MNGLGPGPRLPCKDQYWPLVEPLLSLPEVPVLPEEPEDSMLPEEPLLPEELLPEAS